MNYEFSLNKTAVISVIAGSIVIGILLFAAGAIVGMQWSPGGSRAESSTTAKNGQAELPKEPVLGDDASTPKSDSPKSVNPKLAEPKDPAPTAPEEAALSTQTQPAATGEVKIIQEAEVDPANENAAVDPEYVTVQIGVFLDEQEAGRLLQQVERKGYAPSFFSGRDAEARQWYAVRIGAYSDKQQATNAATNFTRQEKIKAVVRPLGSL